MTQTAPLAIRYTSPEKMREHRKRFAHHLRRTYRFAQEATPDAAPCLKRCSAAMDGSCTPTQTAALRANTTPR